MKALVLGSTLRLNHRNPRLTPRVLIWVGAERDGLLRYFDDAAAFTAAETLRLAKRLEHAAEQLQLRTYRAHMRRKALRAARPKRASRRTGAVQS